AGLRSASPPRPTPSRARYARRSLSRSRPPFPSCACAFGRRSSRRVAAEIARFEKRTQLFARRFLEVVERAFGQHAARRQERNAIGNERGLREVVRDEDC